MYEIAIITLIILIQVILFVKITKLKKRTYQLEKAVVKMIREKMEKELNKEFEKFLNSDFKEEFEEFTRLIKNIKKQKNDTKKPKSKTIRKS